MMEVFAETDRIILRELVLEDAPYMFIMDADPEVHRYLGKKPIQTIREATDMILFIRKQYKDFGIGRWAIVDKVTNTFIGWSGLKFHPDTINSHTDFYEVGYRLSREFWGHGYGTESALASVKYAFEQLDLPAVYAMADCENQASRKVLLKVGLKITGQFTYDGEAHHWFELKKTDWKK
ncbi:MAG: GNAT family N-acetyltransferase [Candidatus Pedobacter colombiensis]|uniref:GNAT family N-acetyltransferase n=1 Tax=Candidatus Pedobacter colombiensis TaxID=3121371 RepID=A0AAJ6B562_9SPHI|nr:GNAT family N-acetyltransferase [Pedobacter sp.]WEK17449.1 MAG: GNAT family N-acetyltransferase [Pedobacter sp.]